MAKEEGAKTVVIGGKHGVQQEYCGTVGGQSSDFSTMDTEVKARHFYPQSSFHLAISRAYLIHTVQPYTSELKTQE